MKRLDRFKSTSKWNSLSKYFITTSGTTMAGGLTIKDVFIRQMILKIQLGQVIRISRLISDRAITSFIFNVVLAMKMIFTNLLLFLS